MQHQNPDFALKTIKAAAIASDNNFLLWSPREVDRNRRWLRKKHGREITLETLLKRHAPELVLPHFQELLTLQKRYMEAMTYYDPSSCYLCGETENLYAYTCGLKRIVKDDDWSVSAFSALVSVISLPLLGIGRLQGPQRQTETLYAMLKFVVCDTCWRKRGLKLEPADMASHPGCAVLKGLGYTKYVSRERLPPDLLLLEDVSFET